MLKHRQTMRPLVIAGKRCEADQGRRGNKRTCSDASGVWKALHRCNGTRGNAAKAERGHGEARGLVRWIEVEKSKQMCHAEGVLIQFGVFGLRQTWWSVDRQRALLAHLRIIKRLQGCVRNKTTQTKRTLEIRPYIKLVDFMAYTISLMSGAELTEWSGRAILFDAL